jgi:tetratricopeptide (TPR) repeat protein
MKRPAFLLASLLFASCFHLLAQASIIAQWQDAVVAYQRGDNAAVIRILQPIVQCNEIQGVALGDVWALLAAAYEEGTQYRLAENAYTRAIPLLQGSSPAVRDYEVALRQLGSLYREMNEFGPAEKLEGKSLQISEQNHDHVAIARTCAALSELSLDRNRLKDGERYIGCAESESQLTSEFDDNDRAYVAQLEGLLSLDKGDVQDAIHDYQRSIDLFTNRYGANFAFTGWGYILLASAYAQGGIEKQALEAMRRGMTILKSTVGSHDPRYAVAEIQYADLLKKIGQDSWAAQVKAQGEATLEEFQRTQCAGCTISVAAFR